MFKSLSLEQVVKADKTAKLDERIIPYSSILEVSFKEPKEITITQQVRTGLAAEIYGGSTTWKFEILEDKKQIAAFVELLKQLLPGQVFK